MNGVNGVKRFAEKFKHKLQNDPCENQTTLFNMNIDCKFLIFEQLNFESLLNIAQANKEFAISAVNVFRRKFSDKMIVIECHEDNLPKQNTGWSFNIWDTFHGTKTVQKISYFISEDQLKIQDYKMILNTLRIFGGEIKRLKIVYNGVDVIKSKVITWAINKYCADSLIELKLDECFDSVLNYMLKPFKKVKNIIFLKSFRGMSSYKALPMNELFPQVQHLSLFLTTFSSHYPICYLPQLQHLNLHISSEYENNTVNFIQINPHIRSIDLRSPTSKILDSVNRVLLNLENITISLYTAEDNTMHFDSVTKFKAEDSVFYPGNVTFSQLHELSMNCYGEKCDRWIDFLKKHRNISRFHIDHSNMNDDQFNRITDLPNLIEMTISHLQGEPFQIETIVRFLEDHDKIIKFNLGSCRQSEKEILRGKFEEHWTITDYHKCLTFKRRVLA